MADDLYVSPHNGCNGVRIGWEVICQHVRSVIACLHTERVLDADPAKTFSEQGIDRRPVDHVVEGSGQRFLRPDGRGQIEPRFNSDGHAYFQITVEAQELVPELWSACSTWSVAGQIAEILHVVHVKPDQVAKAMGEEQGVGAAVSEFRWIAAQQTSLDESFADHAGCQVVNVSIALARNRCRDCSALGTEDSVIKMTLYRRELPVDRVRAGDVTGVASRLFSPCINQKQLTRLDRALVHVIVKDFTTDSHIRRKRRFALVGHKYRAERSRDIGLISTRRSRPHRRHVGVNAHLCGLSHCCKFVLILDESQTDDGLQLDGLRRLQVHRRRPLHCCRTRRSDERCRSIPDARRQIVGCHQAALADAGSKRQLIIRWQLAQPDRFFDTGNRSNEGTAAVAIASRFDEPGRPRHRRTSEIQIVASGPERIGVRGILSGPGRTGEDHHRAIQGGSQLRPTSPIGIRRRGHPDGFDTHALTISSDSNRSWRRIPRGRHYKASDACAQVGKVRVASESQQSLRWRVTDGLSSGLLREGLRMRRRVWLSLVFIVVVVGGGITWYSLRSRAPKAVFLIVVDTLRSDRLSCYGYEGHETPNIDRLAEMGVKFTRAYSVASWTVPSMGAMLTSLYPTQLSLIEYPGPPGKRFEPREKRRQRAYTLPGFPETLAEILNESGFRTAGFVDQPALNYGNGFLQGFMDWFYPVGPDEIKQHDPQVPLVAQEWPGLQYADRSDLALIREFEKWLSTNAGSRPFVWIHLLTPHRPYKPAAKYMPQGGHEELGEPSDADRYNGEVRAVDDMVGLILDAIDRHIGLGRSLIVFTSDHGEELGERGMKDHGHTLHREIIQIPLLICSPLLPRGRTVDTHVREIDLVPTMLTLLDQEPSIPENSEGTNLIETIMKKGQSLPVFSEGMLYGSTERSLIEGGFKLMYDAQEEQPRLYNVLSDPGETVDLAAEQPERRDTMRSALWHLHNRLRNEYVDRFGSQSTTPQSEEDQQRALDALRALGYVGD